ncbi:MAG TPA: hypothetical protein VG960_02420 [Caulobacteraceae bacterium]|nr:hypothetical protein [Caulobacteraceae bacterium]
MLNFADLSNGVAAELSELGGLVDELQPMLSALVCESSDPVDLAQYEKLQTLDYISQHLQALAQFLSVLAGEIAAQTEVDCRRALSSITLSDLSERLLQSSTLAPTTEPDDEDPDWELF